jgi:hypothetical protein
LWEGEHRPFVRLRLRVSDPEWATHLRAGMTWRSAAHSSGAGDP